MTIIPVLRRQRQEDQGLRASLGYIMRHCLKRTKQITFKNSNWEKRV
jgi:hypothetical protein